MIPKQQHLLRLVTAVLMAITLIPQMVGVAGAAGELEPRSVTMSTSSPAASSATTTYTFNFRPSATATIKAIGFQICDSPVQGVGCTQTAGALGGSFAGAAFSTAGQSAPFNATWATGGACGSPAAGFICITNATGSSLNNATTYSVIITGIQNPTTTNTEFYTRITTYTDAAGTVQQDFGGVAQDTATQLTVQGTMPESLVFCVGTSGTDCTNMTGTTVNLGTFSPTVAATGTSVMNASTNASSGYVISINGGTLQSGANTISPMGTQVLNSSGCAPSCSSTTGVSQFGSNTVANTVPAVGANVTPTGAGYNGAASGGYGTANSFRFFTGDTVASSSAVSNAQLFTNSYIVNVPGSQAAGLYTSTITYICTATF